MGYVIGLTMLHAGRAGLARGRWLVAGRRVAEEEGFGGLGGSCPVERSFYSGSVIGQQSDSRQH